MNKNVMIAAMIAAAALMLALVAPVSAQFSPLVMHKARILDAASRVHKDARPLSMVLPGGGRVSPTEETFEAMRSMMESTSTKKLVLSAAQQAGGNNLTLFSSPNSCNATSTSIDLTLFSGMYGKCLSYPSGSIILALCNSMAGGTTSFTLGQFMLPNCPNTDKNATVLFAAGAPTDKTGCFTMTVVTPTVSATLGAQVKCPPA